MSFASHVAQGDGTDTLGFDVSGGRGQVGARFDAFGRPRQGTTGAPVVAVAAGAGAGATVTAHTGTDSHGTITIHTAGTPAPGALATVTFVNPYTGTNPPVVQIEPKDAGANLFYWAACTNTVLTINVVGTPGTGVNLAFDYFVVGGA
jgi:hypothetical protein